MRGVAVFFAAFGFIIPGLAVWIVNPASDEVVSPATVIDARFPDELDYLKTVDPVQSSAAKIDETFDVLLGGSDALKLRRVDPSEHVRLHSVLRTHRSTIGGAARSSEVVTDASLTEARTLQPRNAMFNDAQIASIKAQLALDRDQEQYWPAVEAALRTIVWRAGGSTGAELDPISVQKLAIASATLIDMLRENQKRELRIFARLMGLDKLASQL